MQPKAIKQNIKSIGLVALLAKVKELHIAGKPVAMDPSRCRRVVGK